MRIGIDARELCGQPTGVGRYVSHLLEAWRHVPEEAAHDYGLIVPADAVHPHLDALVAGSSLRLSIERVGDGSGTAWEQWQLPRARAARTADVLFCPAYTGPILTRTPTVVTIHDLSFVAHPEWFPPRTRLRRGILTRAAARRARLVLTVSRFSRDEIVRLLGVPAERVRPILHGLTTPLQPPGPVADERPGESGALVLYVGSVFNRRHLPDLIAAVRRVASRHPGVRLEAVGDNRTWPYQDLDALAADAGDCVTVRSYVPDSVLAGLYARASVFAFLSDYEGFGLTPLEALAAGVPVLVGDTAVAREIYGPAAVYVPTTDVEAVACGLETLLFDPDVRRRHLDAAPSVLARFSWDRAARETLAALQEAGR